MYVVTGATGKLGRLVLEALLEKVPASEVAVTVRSPEKASALAARGVAVRKADYSKPETFVGAFAKGDKVLLISSSEVGQRASQHAVVIDAAKKAGVALVAYTSILHGDASGLALAPEHITTEKALRASGVPFVFLRNGWYIENYTENLGPALEHGAMLGSAGAGRIAAATRADFAAAAVAVLTGPTAEHAGKAYELAGDSPFTMAEIAAVVAAESGKAVVYKDLPAAEYKGFLLSVGVPEPMAAILVDADLGIARGELDDRSGTLARLIGRATTPLTTAVRAALKK